MASVEAAGPGFGIFSFLGFSVLTPVRLQPFFPREEFNCRRVQ